MSDLVTDYERWLGRLPASVTADSIWNVSAYKQSLYARKRAYWGPH